MSIEAGCVAGNGGKPSTAKGSPIVKVSADSTDSTGSTGSTGLVSITVSACASISVKSSGKLTLAFTGAIAIFYPL